MLRLRSSTATGMNAISASPTSGLRPPSHHRHTSSRTVQPTANASLEIRPVNGASTCTSGGGYQ
jgi:hypothetical protein